MNQVARLSTLANTRALLTALARHGMRGKVYDSVMFFTFRYEASYKNRLDKLLEAALAPIFGYLPLQLALRPEVFKLSVCMLVPKLLLPFIKVAYRPSYTLPPN